VSKPFTVQTYNAHDKGTPERTTFIHITERPPRPVLEAFAAQYGYGLFYPKRGTDAMLWDESRLSPEGYVCEQEWESGRDHGVPGTTPDGFVLSWWGRLDDELDDGDEVAFVGSHLVNNAFGPILRGERWLRLKLWWQGWNAIRVKARHFRKSGYRTFKLGDFNRRPAHWPQIVSRSIGIGYDRIIHPASAKLLKAWRGDREGSDHRPLIGQYRFVR
jgi:hypothetical protein